MGLHQMENDDVRMLPHQHSCLCVDDESQHGVFTLLS